MLTGDVSDSFFGGGEGLSKRKYPNPFYGIPLQYLPLNIDHQLWWAEQFLLRFGFYRTSLELVADYFITELTVECDDEEAQEEYKELFEELGWKKMLAEAGLNLLAFGNLYFSINQGFLRALSCPKCSKVTVIDRIKNFDFKKNQYTTKCVNCGHNGPHRALDRPVKDTKKIISKIWSPREVKLIHDETTNQSEYYWEIPTAYAKKITSKDNKFFAKVVPKVIFEALEQKKMVLFNNNNFIHLKIPCPATLKTDGRAIPPCMYMFDNFFMLKVVERYNEVICYEDINPFRVISMASNTSPSNPVLGHQEGGAWAAAVDNMLASHKRDPGSYHKFPFTFEFQHLGGDARQLAPVELMEYMQKNILTALKVPVEFFQMTLTQQAVGPALRLFENAHSGLVDAYNRLLQHIGQVIAKIRGLPPAKFHLIPITFADDMERKSVIGQLVSSNSIARSEFLNLYNYDYKDQLRKKLQEDQAAAEIQEEEQKKQELRRSSQKSIFGQQQQGGAGQQFANVGGGGSPQQVLEQAQELAQQMHPLQPHERREALQSIKAQDETLYSATKTALKKMDDEAKSQGLQQSKQQGQQG